MSGPTRPFVAAAVQFATGGDVDENLATCLRMVDRAADEGAELVVLPEFCNHRSVYESADHCRSVALELDGPFLGALADRAATHRLHLVVTATVRRVGRVTITSVMLGPGGTRLGVGDKQTLMGNERQFLADGAEVAPVVVTDLGPIGMYACMDGVTPETPRALTVKGARVLTNSLNSFALDEAALHIPVRAAENAVFVVAANKVGPLLPPDRVAEFSAAMGIPAEMLHGAGESQIVGPDGAVLAKAPRTGEAVVAAEIASGPVDRAAPHPVRDRRPVLARALVDDHEVERAEAADAVAVAAIGGEHVDTERVAGVGLVVLPELVEPPAEVPDGMVVVSSRRDGDRHIGEVRTSTGTVAEQPQLLACARHPWASDLGDAVTTVDLPFGRLAVVVGDDLLLPEIARSAAVLGADVLAVVGHVDRAWVNDLLVVERAAESRVCVAVGSRATDAGGPVVVDLPPEFTLWHPDRTRPYDGTINTPDVHRDGEMVRGTIHPARAANDQISKGTHLRAGRARRSAAVVAAPALS